MKVSERIKDIRANVNVVDGCSINHDRLPIIQQQLIQLEVEIVEALQIARQEGYRAGFNNRATWDTKDKQPVDDTTHKSNVGYAG